MATPVDPDSQAAINMHTIAQLKSFIASAREFVSKVYIPDLLAIASFYKDWAGHGRGVGNYMSFGEYPADGALEVLLGDGEARVSNAFLMIPLRTATEFANKWIRAFVSARRVVRVLALRPEVTDPDQAYDEPPVGATRPRQCLAAEELLVGVHREPESRRVRIGLGPSVFHYLYFIPVVISTQNFYFRARLS